MIKVIKIKAYKKSIFMHNMYVSRLTFHHLLNNTTVPLKYQSSNTYL